MGNCRSSIGLVGWEVFSGAAQRRWLGQDCGFTFPPHTELYRNLPAFLWTLPFCKILKCVAVVSLSSRSTTVLAVLLTNPALPASVPCGAAEPVAIPGNSPEPWSHFDDIYQFLLTLHSIYYLFLGYFYKASFSFLIKIPHFGLYLLYIQGGLFFLLFRQYLSSFIILSGLLSLWISLFYKCQGSATNGSMTHDEGIY